MDPAPHGDHADSAAAYFASLRRRIAELEADGLSHLEAWNQHQLERRIEQWPAEWGNTMHVLIYGDFQRLQSAMSFPSLRIIVEPASVNNTIVRSAACVLPGRVEVTGRTIESLVDAARRLNRLVGAIAASGWGVPCGWWSHVTHGGLATSLPEIQKDRVNAMLEADERLPPRVAKRVRAALYWMRDPLLFGMEGYRSDSFRAFAGYWNAFECLVDAVCEYRTLPTPPDDVKQKQIDAFLTARKGRLDPAALSQCYREVLDTGFRKKASHALRVCFGDSAKHYVRECFEVKPDSERLYNIRNAINHGTIECDDFTRLAWIESKRRRLWMIVFRMLAQFLPVPCPGDDDLPTDSVPGTAMGS